MVASHAHLDHIIGRPAGPRRDRARFLLNEADLPIARNLAASARNLMGRDVPDAPHPDAFAADGDDLEIAGITLRVLHTQGHTPGSICFYAPDARPLVQWRHPVP